MPLAKKCLRAWSHLYLEAPVAATDVFALFRAIQLSLYVTINMTQR